MYCVQRVLGALSLLSLDFKRHNMDISSCLAYWQKAEKETSGRTESSTRSDDFIIRNKLIAYLDGHNSDVEQLMTSLYDDAPIIRLYQYHKYKRVTTFDCCEADQCVGIALSCEYNIYQGVGRVD